MKAGWKTERLGDVCSLIARGVAPKYTETGGKLVLNQKCVRDHVLNFEHGRRHDDSGRALASDRLLKPGDVLVNSTGTGTLGRVAQVRAALLEPTTVDTHVTIVRPMPGKFFADFFGYMLVQIEDEIAAGGEGASGQTELARATLANKFFVSYPESLEEQRRIVTMLDEAFAGIATATANAQKNLTNARTIFDGVLERAVEAAHSSCKTVPLTELASDISDGDHMPPPKALTGVPFITIGNINKRSRAIDFSDTYMVSHDYFSALKPNRKPRRGDVLYTVTGSFGIPVLVDQDGDFCFQRHIGLVRPKPTTDSRWLSYLLRSPQVFSQAEDGATGTAQKTVSLKVLRNFRVPNVALANQIEAAGRLDVLSAEVDRLANAYQRKVAGLTELKQSLLQKAFAGQLVAAISHHLPDTERSSFTTPQFIANVIAFAHRKHEAQNNQKTFGRVKAQKSLHLVESIGRIDLGREPMRDAAGPNDFPHMLRAEEWAEAQRFFKFVPRASGGYDFKKLENFEALWSRAGAATTAIEFALEKAISPIVPMTSLEAELFVTVHAAWNNLIRDNVPISDDAIIRAARDDWHPDKLKIAEHKFREALRQVRAKGCVPDGTAKYVGGQASLL